MPPNRIGRGHQKMQSPEKADEDVKVAESGVETPISAHDIARIPLEFRALYQSFAWKQVENSCASRSG
ncbi:hypothetical protein LZ554_007318 [Drepanopeziza brunnea f. sp. 'monogermtubi']|nr:hypothetical protein LZ554_007318 [Drepanopeziza brunnea f. sp. 'monogermtubi']